MNTQQRGAAAGMETGDEMVERWEGSSEMAVETGITRREALKRGAIVGGAVVWAAPLVQAVGMTSAAGQTGTPIVFPAKGISFIVFRFQCGNQTYAVKVDDPGTAGAVCGPIPGDNPGQDCGVEAQPGDINGGAACGLFTLQVVATNAEGEVTQVRVVFPAGSNCTVLPGGQSKCADQCVPAQGNLFFGCPN